MIPEKGLEPLLSTFRALRPTKLGHSGMILACQAVVPEGFEPSTFCL